MERTKKELPPACLVFLGLDEAVEKERENITDKIALLFPVLITGEFNITLASDWV